MKHFLAKINFQLHVPFTFLPCGPWICVPTLIPEESLYLPTETAINFHYFLLFRIIKAISFSCYAITIQTPLY